MNSPKKRPKRRRFNRKQGQNRPSLGTDPIPTELESPRDSFEDVYRLLKTGLSYHQSDQLQLAIEFYERVLSLDPRNSEALNLLGVVAYQSVQLETAIDLISTAIEIQPQIASYHLNLGTALAAAERSSEAAQSFRTAVELDPNLGLAHGNLANLLFSFGDLSTAAVHFQSALKYASNDPQIHSNYAALLIELGSLDVAETHLRRALELEPKLAEAICNLAILKTRQGESEQAIDYYQSALQRNPKLLTAWNNLGQLLAEQGAVSEAKTAYRQAHQLDSRKFRKLKQETVCPVIPESQEQITQYRENLSQTLQRFSGGDLELKRNDWEKSASTPPFYLAYHGCNDLELKSRWNDLFRPQLPVLDPPVRRSQKTHVGFVVADRHVPVFWRFMGGFVQQLPTDKLTISLFGSHDSIRNLNQRLKQRSNPAAVRLTELPPKLIDAAQAIRSHVVDCLHFFEPEADPFNYFLSSLPVSRIQVTSWGIPVTSGIATMTDYLSCHLIEPEQASQHYRERLVRFDRLPVYYQRPQSAPVACKTSFGFNEQDRIYGCPQSLFKFHPDFDFVLAEILRRDPRGKIGLIAGRNRYWAELLRQRWRQVMPDVVDRIVFVPQLGATQFLSFLAVCDVLLDPFPFGGGATTYEAMSVGTPVVTLPGEFMRGRVTLGCWKQMGIEDCIANDVEDYLNKSISIASDTTYRASLKKIIHEASDQLFEDQAAVDELANWLLEKI